MTDGESLSVHRALDVLEFLASSGQSEALTSITKHVGAPKATAHRLLATLQSRGYVSQELRTGRYAAGIRCFELGSLWAQNLDLRAVAAPHLATLNEETGETVHLAVYEHGDVVYVDKLESRHQVVPKSNIGRRSPAFCVATGRALLAFQSLEEIAGVLDGPLPTYTARTITSRSELETLLTSVRTSGYAVNHGSYRDEVGGIAAPIRNHTGSVIAAVGCCLPETRFGEDRFETLRDRTVIAAARISAELGTPTPLRAGL